MAENALSPAFVRINYASPYGGHVMTVPSVPYILPDVGNVSGQFDLRGAALSTPAHDAVVAYVNVLKPFFNPGVVFSDYTIFTQADAAAVALPQYTDTLNIAGTTGLGATQWAKASQGTITFRTETFGIFKIVLLDAWTIGWDPFRSATATVQLGALVDYVTDDVSWLSGRDGGRPKTFLQMSWTLNEHLRRAYNMN